MISVEANPVGQTANVAFDPARTSVGELRRWVEGCGYHCAGQSVPEHSVGFDPMTVRRGDGLRNLEQRSAALGGTTSIDSVPGKGTTVRIELSL